MWHLRASRISLWLLLLTLYLHHCYAANIKFICPKKKANDTPLPHLPLSYSSNVRFNYVSERRSVEARHLVKGSNQVIELTSASRHVKYINRPDKKLLLTIVYDDDEQPSCKVEPSPGDGVDFLKSEDCGPSNILKVFSQKLATGWDDFVPTFSKYDDGTFLLRWEGCFQNPSINISIGYTQNNWIPFQTSSLTKVDRFIQKIDAEMEGDVLLSAVFSRFDPTTPPDAEFQPPKNVFCEGWGSDVPIPEITNFFSYNSEILVYESAAGIRPYISQRKVFYDYPGGISRTDFYDALAETPDIFTPIRARAKTVIHDFKAGVQYTLDPVTGKCSFDEFQTTLSVISVKFSETEDMPTSKKYFYLDTSKIYYNGEYSTRGLNADVFNAEVTIEGLNYKGPSIVSWYFTKNKTQAVEGLRAEKNVLLRMVVRPKSGVGKENMAVVNFYNFIKAEPEEHNYDLTGCYNESYSKHLTFTFPAHESLKGYEKLISQFMRDALVNVTDIDRHRITIKEVSFSGDYMYVEFFLLDNPPIKTKFSKPSVTLKDAYDKLQKAAANKNFNVRVETAEKVVILKLEPQGLNEFSGDRHLKKTPEETGYKQGSVIGLTIGMLFLGIVLGGITINLVVSRKFGVSLFQGKRFGDQPFDNPLGESSM